MPRRHVSTNPETMNRYIKRALIGALAGGFAGVALASTLAAAHWTLGLGLGIGLGMAYGLGMSPARGAYVDGLMVGGSLGIPLWGLMSVIAIPLLSGQLQAMTGLRWWAKCTLEVVQRLAQLRFSH